MTEDKQRLSAFIIHLDIISINCITFCVLAIDSIFYGSFFYFNADIVLNSDRHLIEFPSVSK